jgi:hypothetical protein
VIVRISGEGQFDLDDDAVRRLDALDTELTEAMNAGDEQRFHQALSATVQFVRESGSPVAHERVVPSEVVVPPDDVSLEEARGFFTDEGLMQPIPA